MLTSGTSVAVLSFLLKLWIEKRLSYSLDLKLEKFKSELAKEVARDSIQQRWINDKRMELLHQLYELMMEMDFELKSLYLNIKVQSQELTKARAEKFAPSTLSSIALFTRTRSSSPLTSLMRFG